MGRKPTQIVNGVDCRKCIDGVGGWQSNGQVGGVEQRCQGKTSVCSVRHTTVQNRGYSTEQSDACDRMSDAVHDLENFDDTLGELAECFLCSASVSQRPQVLADKATCSYFRSFLHTRTHNPGTLRKLGIPLLCAICCIFVVQFTSDNN